MQRCDLVSTGGAMGVRQDYYAAFATWLAGRGYLVASFDYRGVGESKRAPLRGYAGATEHVERAPVPEPEEPESLEGLRLVCYKPLFSGAAVQRVPELQFQRPEPEIELAPADAAARKIAAGDTVTVSHNGTSLELRARISHQLREGVARVATEHAGELGGRVEVT